MHMYEKLIRENRVGFENMAEVHSTLSEDLSFRHIIRLAENVEGMALYMMHVSAETGVAAIANRARAASRSTARRCTSTCCTRTRTTRGRTGRSITPIRRSSPERDRLALWQGTVSGEISTVATDGYLHAAVREGAGRRIDDTTGGNAGVEPRVSVMYTETVEKRGYTPGAIRRSRLRQCGAHHGPLSAQGRHRRGQRCRHRHLRSEHAPPRAAEDLHETDYRPWEGNEVAGWPRSTMLRGKVMVADGKFHGDLKDGQYLKRKIPDAILARQRKENG